MRIRDRVFNKLESLGYIGIDRDLECSLFEYGFIALDKPLEKELFLRVKVQNVGMEFARIEYGYLSYQDIDQAINESWFNKSSFLSYVRQDEDEWLNNPYVSKIYDLFSYYGYENFGFSPYMSISIKDFFKSIIEEK